MVDGQDFEMGGLNFKYLNTPYAPAFITRDEDFYARE